MAYQDYYDAEGSVKTSYNSNLATIMRMDKLEHSIIGAFIDKDLNYATILLELFFSELEFKIYQMKGSKKKENLEKTSEIMEWIKSIKEDAPKAKETYRYNQGIYLKNPKLNSELWERLMLLKLELGRLKYKSGLGMTDADDPRLAVAE